MTGGAADEGTPWRVFAAEAQARFEAAGVESAEVSVRRIIERAAGFDGGVIGRRPRATLSACATGY